MLTGCCRKARRFVFHKCILLGMAARNLTPKLPTALGGREKSCIRSPPVYSVPLLLPSFEHKQNAVCCAEVSAEASPCRALSCPWYSENTPAVPPSLAREQKSAFCSLGWVQVLTLHRLAFCKRWLRSGPHCPLLLLRGSGHGGVKCHEHDLAHLGG